MRSQSQCLYKLEFAFLENFHSLLINVDLYETNLGDKPAAVRDVAEYLVAERSYLCILMGYREHKENGQSKLHILFINHLIYLFQLFLFLLNTINLLDMLNKYFPIDSIIITSSVWKEFFWLQVDLHLFNNSLRESRVYWKMF